MQPAPSTEVLESVASDAAARLRGQAGPAAFTIAEWADDYRTHSQRA